MTPAQALGSATTTAAELLGLEDRLGRIHPATSRMSSPWTATPLQSIDALFTGVRWVMKDGKVVVDKR